MLDLDEYDKWTSANTMHIGYRRMRELISECRELRCEVDRLAAKNKIDLQALGAANESLAKLREGKQ